MLKTAQSWAIARRAGVAIGAYIAGWFAVALIFLIANGSGIEAQTKDALPYYAVFSV
jgi:hypothetical protein